MKRRWGRKNGGLTSMPLGSSCHERSRGVLRTIRDGLAAGEVGTLDALSPRAGYCLDTGLRWYGARISDPAGRFPVNPSTKNAKAAAPRAGAFSVRQVSCVFRSPWPNEDTHKFARLSSQTTERSLACLEFSPVRLASTESLGPLGDRRCPKERADFLVRLFCAHDERT